MKAYKYLAPGSRGRFSDVAWPTPDADRAGDWLAAGEPIATCQHGIHACAVEHLLDWIDAELWEVELAGEIVHTEALLVAERGRLVRRVEAWNEETAQGFTNACAWRAREQALSALREVGLTDEAEQLVAAFELKQLQDAAASAAGGGTGPAETATAFVADAISLAQGQRPEAWLSGNEPAGPPPHGVTAANVAFVVAHAIGLRAASGGGDYTESFAAERAWQLDWLVRELGLSEPALT